MAVRRGEPNWAGAIKAGLLSAALGCALSLGALPGAAQGPAPEVEQPAPEAKQPHSNAMAKAVEQLELAAQQLAAQDLSGKSDEELAQIAKRVVNILEGVTGKHFAVDVPNPGDGTGVITYLERATGRSRAEFPADQLPALAESDQQPPEVQALIHVLLADAILTGEAVTAKTLDEARAHIDQALELLQSSA